MGKLIWCLALVASGFMAGRLMAQDRAPVTLTFTQAQTAGIDGRVWDKPFPNAVTLDAVHRAVLLRFPGAAEPIAAKLREGYRIDKAHVRLTFVAHEARASGYSTAGDPRFENAIKADPPRWHVVAWPLRRPWTTDTNSAPTFNAYLQGAGYWARYGARDTQQDRFPQTLGPSELSYTNTLAQLDVTALLSEKDFGKTLGDRLRHFEEQGLLLQKWELYDNRYHTHPTVPPQRAYEWIVCVGGCGLTFKSPELVVTLAPAEPAAIRLPPATDLPALAERLRSSGKGGKPMALMPTDDDIIAMSNRVFRQPEWMADWQWKRIQELRVLSKSMGPRDLESGVPELYRKKVSELMSIPPRKFFGWEIAHYLLTWYLYRDLLPVPLQDYIKLYWESQLMPDRPTSQFGHMQQVDWDGGTNVYYQKTGDWRGNHSFFRGAYTRGQSTMNFNNTACMGALLGGAIIGSENAMGDGRYGLEHLVLRLYSSGGSSQESMEPSYFPITLMAQKMFADFGPTPYERLIGRLVTGRNVDEVAAAYHPGLRRIIYPIGRTPLDGMLVSNSGLNHILNTMSVSGTLLIGDLNETKVGGMTVIAPDAPPDGIAYLSLAGPWLPQWCTNMVDAKPIPFSITTGTGGGLKRNYLGRHYGVASTVTADQYQVAPVMAQWKRVPGQARSATELGSFTLNYWVNQPAIRHQYGQRNETLSAMQHENKLLVLMTPKNLKERKDVSALLGAIAFFTQQPTPTWELFVDGVKVEQLPFSCKQGQRITIQDGVSYLGIIPLPGTDLGRDREVVLSVGTNYEGHTAAFYISSYNLSQATPLDPDKTDWTRIQEAVGGFVIELGDEAEDGSFQSFQKQFAAADVKSNWDAEKKAYRVSFQNGPDLLEAAYAPAQGQFIERKVNGRNPYPPEGILRDSSFSQIGNNGRLDKNGAVLLSEEGRMVWLQTDPATGTYAGINMLPDPNLWRMQIPVIQGTLTNSIILQPDGRVGVLRVDVQPSANTINLQYGVKPGLESRDLATALLVIGLKSQPKVTFNDQPLGSLQAVDYKGSKAFVIPLGSQKVDRKAVVARTANAEKALFNSTADRVVARLSRIQHWAVAGPFPNTEGMGLDIAYAPETALNLGTPVPSPDGPLTWIPTRLQGTPATGAAAVNLTQFISTQKWVTAYAVATIRSDRKRPVTLLTCSEGAITVWLNGKPILKQPNKRTMGDDQDRMDVDLRKGMNTLLLKLSRRDEGGWGFACRIADEYGRPLTEGITVEWPEGLPSTYGTKELGHIAPFSMLKTNQLTNLLPGYGGLPDTAELGVNSIYHYTLHETGWPIAFYLKPAVKTPFPLTVGPVPAWTYPYTEIQSNVTFTAHAVSTEIYDGSSLLFLSDAHGRPACKSFYKSGTTSTNGQYAVHPSATLRFPKDHRQRYRLCVVGVSHLSSGGNAPNPNLPVKIAVIPADSQPNTGGMQAEATFVLPRGGNYLDYVFLETVVDRDCDLYLAATHPGTHSLFSLFGVFLVPLNSTGN